MGTPKPVVAVWKSTWLPTSQTFVQNQVTALRRWDPLLLGVRQDPGGLLAADHAPFGHGVLGKVAHRVSEATGYLGVYDGHLRLQSPRLVHAHFGTSAVSVLPLARRHRLPLVATFHGYDITSEPARTDAAGDKYRQQLGTLFGYATTLIAVSDFVAGRLVDMGAPEHKVHVHHIGIPTGHIPTPADGNGRDGIVFVGRLVDKKGVTDLLEAVARLRPAHRSTVVRIVGDGPNRAAAQELATRLGLNVEWLGYQTPAQVAAVLARSAVFCAPSKTAPSGDSEAFGMVFLEAALAGLPVVSYAHGGVPEAVVDGATGLLAPEGDVDALAGNLQRILDDPARGVTMGRAGRARVLSDFDVTKQTSELEEIYDDVADRPFTAHDVPEGGFPRSAGRA